VRHITGMKVIEAAPIASQSISGSSSTASNICLNTEPDNAPSRLLSSLRHFVVEY